MVRQKNSINVAFKNLMDFVVAGLVFWVVGYGLMYGAGHASGLFGTDLFLKSHEDGAGAFFLFQMVFCGAAATVVGGALAERTRLTAYLVIAALVAGVFYPLAGHWVWGGQLDNGTPGWLAELGFIDFAGSTVVHGTGGWLALAAVIVVGPRLGRFDAATPLRGEQLPRRDGRGAGALVRLVRVQRRQRLRLRRRRAEDSRQHLARGGRRRLHAALVRVGDEQEARHRRLAQRHDRGAGRGDGGRPPLRDDRGGPRRHRRGHRLRPRDAAARAAEDRRRHRRLARPRGRGRRRHAARRRARGRRAVPRRPRAPPAARGPGDGRRRGRRLGLRRRLRGALGRQPRDAAPRHGRGRAHRAQHRRARRLDRSGRAGARDGPPAGGRRLRHAGRRRAAHRGRPDRHRVQPRARTRAARDRDPRGGLPPARGGHRVPLHLRERARGHRAVRPRRAGDEGQPRRRRPARVRLGGRSRRAGRPLALEARRRRSGRAPPDAPRAREPWRRPRHGALVRPPRRRTSRSRAARPPARARARRQPDHRARFDHRHQREEGERPPARRTRRGKRREPRQERVPGQHEPRDPHPAERRHRHDRAPRSHRARRAPVALRRHRRNLGGRAPLGHQRHPRRLEDRGRQARAGARRVHAARAPRGRGRHVRPRRRRRRASSSRASCRRTCPPA